MALCLSSCVSTSLPLLSLPLLSLVGTCTVYLFLYFVRFDFGQEFGSECISSWSVLLFHRMMFIRITCPCVL